MSAYGQNFFSNCVLLVTWDNFVNNLFTEMYIQKEFPQTKRNRYAVVKPTWSTRQGLAQWKNESW